MKNLGKRWISVGVVSAAAATVLASVVVGSASADTSASAVSVAHRAKPTIVLEHGAFADASSWSGVVQRLRADGCTFDAGPP
jgi:hypothetical protein